MKRNTITFLQKNYGWIAALLTGGGIVLSFVLTFINYMCSTFYFYYYGISYELYSMEELGFLHNFTFSFLLIFCFCSLIFCYSQLLNIKTKKLNTKIVLLNTFLILISNTLVLYAINNKYSIVGFIISMLFIIITQVLITLYAMKTINEIKNAKNDNTPISEKVKILPFYLFLFILLYLIGYGTNFAMNKSYRIIDNNKAIIYATNDYYLILDCEIKNNELTIYRGKQTKIDNDNVKSKLITFNKIKIK